MKIEIKKILTEDFDLNQPYVSPIVQNAQGYVDSMNSYNQSQNAYNDLIHRGLTSDEKREMLKGMQNLTGDTSQLPLFQQLIPDSDVINKYRMEQTGSMFQDEVNKNYNRGNDFRERESDLRRNVINQHSDISNLNHKLDRANNSVNIAHSQGDLKASVYGGLGLVGGGLVGSTLGAIHMANRLKNRNQR